MSYDDEEGPDTPSPVVEWAVVILCVGTIIYVVGGLLGFW